MLLHLVNEIGIFTDRLDHDGVGFAVVGLLVGLASEHGVDLRSRDVGVDIIGEIVGLKAIHRYQLAPHEIVHPLLGACEIEVIIAHVVGGIDLFRKPGVSLHQIPKLQRPLIFRLGKI